MPRHSASRVLLAPLEDVWAFLAEPFHLADWWPGIAGVQPDRRGLAPGARWRLQAGAQQSFGLALFRRPGAAGTLLVTEVERGRRVAFHLASEHTDAELELESEAPARTRVTLTVQGPWGAVSRSLPRRALSRLFDLVQTSADMRS
ncbi:MAG TPA: SRPBCC family protein [Gaiellaceae bacterium]|nr:SRPBCC family protein [Gaiellaceae bacterium]